MSLKETSVTTVYPMDSLVTSVGQDGLPVYDRPYNASDLRRVMAAYVTDGVVPDSGDCLAVTTSGGSWYVGSGQAMADGLLVRLDERTRVLDQSDVPTGSYALVILAARFDSSLRDAAVYARVQGSPTYEPIRSDSTRELVLARVNWRGEATDLRADTSACGFAAPFEPVDTESFTLALRTAVDQFSLNVGDVTSQAPGTTPTVTVRKPEVAGDPVYVDFGIPRGDPGEPGRDGDAVPACWIRPEDDPPPASYDSVWLVDDKASHEVVGLRCYETDRLYPGVGSFPAADAWPGGAGRWVDHTISKSLIAE